MCYNLTILNYILNYHNTNNIILFTFGTTAFIWNYVQTPPWIQDQNWITFFVVVKFNHNISSAIIDAYSK